MLGKQNVEGGPEGAGGGRRVGRRDGPSTILNKAVRSALVGYSTVIQTIHSFMLILPSPDLSILANTSLAFFLVSSMSLPSWKPWSHEATKASMSS